MLQLHDLSNISGPIPWQFGNLTNLTYLYLGSNSLIGRIPPQLGNLRKLKELYLMLNHLNDAIPPELGQLENLEYLSLFSNSFKGSIPPHLGNLTNLKYLWILSSQLEGTIPAELGKLHNLQELDLSLNSKLSGPIPPELGQLVNLQLLKLFSMNLSGSIPKELGNMKLLQYLHAFSNGLSGVIPSELGQLQSLQDLHLYHNQLSGPLPVNLSKLQNLHSLILFTNKLSGDIPPELGELASLASLSLGDNRFTGYLPSTFGNLENLLYFEASPNYLIGAIPPTLGKLNKLIYLDLSKNRLSGNLPVELANCTKLQWIKLANNSLSGEVPMEYTSFRLLHSLTLAYNSFSGSLPAAFANHSSLVVLNLQRNHFSGRLPDAWARFENLRILSVGYNHLEGPLPIWLYSLKQLQLINLANNNFSGTISSQIIEMDGLKQNASMEDEANNLYKDDMTVELKGTELYFKYVWGIVISLDLSGNALSGVLPNELGSLSGLYNLNLSHNYFTGPIPATLGSVLTLESLDLSDNLLSGHIPQQLTSLTFLSFLNLSDNQLSGEIPKGNQFSLFLNGSYLGNADLCGYPLTSECEVSNTQGTGEHRTLTIKLVVGCVAGIATGIIVIALACYIISKRRQSEGLEALVFDKRIKISAQELSRATKRYNDANIIGRGGSSVVYKGTLQNGMVVAVKRLNMLSHPELQKTFLSEIIILGQIRHRNLVKIWGTLSTRHFKCLILEYLPNGNLDMHLYKDPCNLSWSDRLNIAIGVAHGLVYLHDNTGVGQVLHCDLKPSNILLDEDCEPHISDFGIARLISSRKDGCSSEPILRGSIGYVAPEYAYGEQLTEKVDVYSYGVVLLEMLTRKRPTSDTFGEDISLARWVQSAFHGNWIDVIDPVLCREVAEEKKNSEVYNLLVIAMLCVKEDPRDRPFMRDVMDALLHVKEGKPPYTPVDNLIFSPSSADVYGLSVLCSMGSVSNSSNLFSNDSESSSVALMANPVMQ